MSLEYRVIAPGHTHAGRPLAVGQVVTLRESTAQKFPSVFQRVESPKAARPARNAIPAADATED